MIYLSTVDSKLVSDQAFKHYLKTKTTCEIIFSCCSNVGLIQLTIGNLIAY